MKKFIITIYPLQGNEKKMGKFLSEIPKAIKQIEKAHRTEKGDQMFLEIYRVRNKLVYWVGHETIEKDEKYRKLKVYRFVKGKIRTIKESERKEDKPSFASSVMRSVRSRLGLPVASRIWCGHSQCPNIPGRACQ
ncbi:MAG: hypothetical protein HYY37_03595 [Candidatus Aenigmarchaeota archaeon]|nr:hypothetical protein [Candidatus Aenigmarchaeota archaeon]